MYLKQYLILCPLYQFHCIISNANSERNTDKTESQPKGCQFGKSLHFQLLSRTRSRIIEDLKLRQLPPAQSRTYRLDEQSAQQDEEQRRSTLQKNGAFELKSRLFRLILLLPVTPIHLLTCWNHPGHEISAAMQFFFSILQGSRLSLPSFSGGLFVWVALHLVEFDAVQLLEALVTELTGVVVVRLRSVFLHVPVQRGTLPTLVATNFAPKRGEKKKTKTKETKKQQS